MRGGDCFVLRDRGVDDHLWVVVSEPELDPTQVLIISLTTWDERKDSACQFNANEHPWIKHRTCAAYDFARVVTDAQLEELRVSGNFEMWPPFDAHLLKRIRDRVADSTRIKMEFAEILESQGLIAL